MNEIIKHHSYRLGQIELYQDFLKIRQINLTRSLQVQELLRFTYVEPPFSDPSDPPRPAAPPAVPNLNTLARHLVVNNNISISLDSSTASNSFMGIRRVPYGPPS